MPHSIEPATSGRAKCRGCGRPIDKGELRLGERLPNPYAEGEMTLWFHPTCAAYKRPEALLEALAATGVAVDALGRPGGGGTQEPRASSPAAHRRRRARAARPGQVPELSRTDRPRHVARASRVLRGGSVRAQRVRSSRLLARRTSKPATSRMRSCTSARTSATLIARTSCAPCARRPPNPRDRSGDVEPLACDRGIFGPFLGPRR